MKALEGFSSVHRLGASQAIRRPVPDGRLCPVLGYSIIPEVCAQRRTLPGKCTGADCPHFEAPTPKPIAVKPPEHVTAPSAEQLRLVRRNFPNHPPLPEHTRILGDGNVYIGGSRKKPCPWCKQRWMSYYARCCGECQKNPQLPFASRRAERAANSRHRTWFDCGSPS